ncbi:MAG: hypothetical protein GY754_25590 [bacterium]|nr:hypothetical protein [bacterium]
MFIEELTGVNGVLDPEHNETDTQYAERLLGYLEELTDSIGLQEKLPYESGSEYVFRLERDAKKISRIAGVPEKLPAETDSEYTVRLRRYVENLSGTGKTLKKKKGENDKDYALRLQRKAEKLAGPGSVLEKLPGESDKDYAVRLRRYMEKFSKAKKALFPSRAYTTGTGLKEDTPEELLKKKKAWRKRNLAAAAAILILISALLVVNREKITGSLEELGLIEGKKGLKNGPGEDTAAGAEGNGTEESGNGPHAESGPGEDSAAGVEGSANVSPKIPDGETRKKITVEEDTIIDKYKISVNNFDIYTYANKVAVKNGYNSLSYPKLKHKNPNWIYPENIFIMLDGEKIFVKERDTLWRLARIKLTRMGIHFYELTEKIEKADDSDKRGLLDQAEKYAFKEKHYKIIAELKSKLE